MKKLLEKYYKMEESEKEELKDLYLLQELQKELNNFKELNLSISEEQTIFEIAKDTSKYSNLNVKEIINRILELLECADITIDDIEELSTDEIIEILSKEENDFKEVKFGPEIITAFVYGNFYCVLMREKKEYMLIYEKSDGTQYVDKFKNFQAILQYVIKNKLLSRGEVFV